MKCSYYFGAKRRRLLKVEIVLAPKGAIQNFIKNIRYDITKGKSFITLVADNIFFKGLYGSVL